MSEEAATISAESQKAAVRSLVDGLVKRQRDAVERRGDVRFPFNVPVSLHRITASGSRVYYVSAWAIDLSQSGIGLLTTERIPKEMMVFVNFEPATGRPCFLKLRIVHSKSLIQGIYMSGGLFMFGEAE